MITGLCLLVLLMAKFWPETQLGQWLHRTFVVDLLAMAARIERKHIIFLVIGIFAIQSFAMVMSADLAVLAALDVATYVDAALSVWTVAALMRVKGLGAWASGWARKVRGLRRVTGQRRPRRQRLPMSVRAPANDEEDEAAASLAA